MYRERTDVQDVRITLQARLVGNSLDPETRQINRTSKWTSNFADSSKIKNLVAQPFPAPRSSSRAHHHKKGERQQPSTHKAHQNDKKADRVCKTFLHLCAIKKHLDHSQQEISRKRDSPKRPKRSSLERQLLVVSLRH